MRDFSDDRRRKGSNNNSGSERDNGRLHENRRGGEDVSSYDSAGQARAGRCGLPQPVGLGGDKMRRLSGRRILWL